MDWSPFNGVRSALCLLLNVKASFRVGWNTRKYVNALCISEIRRDKLHSWEALPRLEPSWKQISVPGVSLFLLQKFFCFSQIPFVVFLESMNGCGPQPLGTESGEFLVNSSGSHPVLHSHNLGLDWYVMDLSAHFIPPGTEGQNVGVEWHK